MWDRMDNMDNRSLNIFFLFFSILLKEHIGQFEITFDKHAKSQLMIENSKLHENSSNS
jgi:divalent metal cation (Fe/Co/Zn/Cd) transporter